MDQIDIDQLPANSLLSCEQTATLLHTTPATLSVWRCTKLRGPKHVKLGRKVLYRAGDIRDYIAANVQPGGLDDSEAA